MAKKNNLGFRAFFAMRKGQVQTTFDFYCLPNTLRDAKATRGLESQLFPENPKISATHVLPLHYQNKET